MAFEREWCCCFCLTIAEQKGGKSPDRCPTCHVCRCAKCGTFLKGDSPRLCYGCGAFNPGVEGAFVGTDQTAALYVQDAWMKRNKGCASNGTYCVTTGLARDGSGRRSSWIAKRVGLPDGTVGCEDVRELTEEEKAAWLSP